MKLTENQEKKDNYNIYKKDYWKGLVIAALKLWVPYAMELVSLVSHLWFENRLLDRHRC